MGKPFRLAKIVAGYYSFTTWVALGGFRAEGVDAIVLTVATNLSFRFLEWCLTPPDPDLTWVSLRSDQGSRRIDS